MGTKRVIWVLSAGQGSVLFSHVYEVDITDTDYRSQSSISNHNNENTSTVLRKQLSLLLRHIPKAPVSNKQEEPNRVPSEEAEPEKEDELFASICPMKLSRFAISLSSLTVAAKLPFYFEYQYRLGTSSSSSGSSKSNLKAESISFVCCPIELSSGQLCYSLIGYILPPEIHANTALKHYVSTGLKANVAVFTHIISSFIGTKLLRKAAMKVTKMTDEINQNSTFSDLLFSPASYRTPPTRRNGAGSNSTSTRQMGRARILELGDDDNNNYLEAAEGEEEGDETDAAAVELEQIRQRLSYIQDNFVHSLLERWTNSMESFVASWTAPIVRCLLSSLQPQLKPQQHTTLQQEGKGSLLLSLPLSVSIASINVYYAQQSVAVAATASTAVYTTNSVSLAPLSSISIVPEEMHQSSTGKAIPLNIDRRQLSWISKDSLSLPLSLLSAICSAYFSINCLPTTEALLVVFPDKSQTRPNNSTSKGQAAMVVVRVPMSTAADGASSIVLVCQLEDGRLLLSAEDSRAIAGDNNVFVCFPTSNSSSSSSSGGSSFVYIKRLKRDSNLVFSTSGVPASADSSVWAEISRSVAIIETMSHFDAVLSNIVSNINTEKLQNESISTHSKNAFTPNPISETIDTTKAQAKRQAWQEPKTPAPATHKAADAADDSRRIVINAPQQLQQQQPQLWLEFQMKFDGLFGYSNGLLSQSTETEGVEAVIMTDSGIKAAVSGPVVAARAAAISSPRPPAAPRSTSGAAVALQHNNPPTITATATAEETVIESGVARSALVESGMLAVGVEDGGSSTSVISTIGIRRPGRQLVEKISTTSTSATIVQQQNVD